MALIKFGAIIVDTRGTFGGQTIKASRTTNVLYNKQSPRSKASPRKSRLTENLGTLSRSWSTGLTQAQRDDWNALATANPRPDRWGNLFPLTGISLFVGVNALRTQLGLSTISDAPADQTVTGLATLAVTATAPATLSIAFTPSPLPADHVLYLFSREQLSPGISNVSHRLAFLTASGAAIASPFSPGAAYVARFGDLVAGRATPIDASLINTTNGARSSSIVSIALTT